jgi:TonB family protein
VQTSRSRLRALVCAIGVLCGPISGFASDGPLPKNLDCRPKRGDTVNDYYPETARRLGLQGRVLLDVQLDEHGSLGRPVIVSSDKNKDLPDYLNEAATKVVRALRCTPLGTSVLGESAKGAFRVSVVFELAPGGVLLPHPGSDWQLTITAARIDR